MELHELGSCFKFKRMEGEVEGLMVSNSNTIHTLERKGGGSFISKMKPSHEDLNEEWRSFLFQIQIQIRIKGELDGWVVQGLRQNHWAQGLSSHG